jgi:hypothetical protein
VQHYHLEFVQGSGKPRVYSVPMDKIQHVTVAYEAIEYMTPLSPTIRNAASQHEHSMMIIWPRSDWARLFLQWTSELKKRMWKRQVPVGLPKTQHSIK